MTTQPAKCRIQFEIRFEIELWSNYSFLSTWILKIHRKIRSKEDCALIRDLAALTSRRYSRPFMMPPPMTKIIFHSRMKLSWSKTVYLMNYMPAYVHQKKKLTYWARQVFIQYSQQIVVVVFRAQLEQISLNWMFTSVALMLFGIHWVTEVELLLLPIHFGPIWLLRPLITHQNQL